MSETVTSTPDPAPMSIGEVLSVLQSEFPDVTISKIRFLESQGLVRPERNASGYRQFASGDIERLTWILRQQRDHFLPLKVIKKALDRGVEVPDAGDGEQPTLWSAAADAVVADELSHQRATDAAEAAVAAETAEVAEPSGHPADGSAGRDVTRRAPVPVAVPAGASHAPPDEDPGQGRGTRRHSTPADVVAALQEEPRSVRSKNAGSQPRAASAGHDSAPPGSEERRPAGSTPSAGAPDPEPAPAAVPVGRPVTDRGDLQHTRDELLALAGVDEELLDGLEEFGLVVATLDAGEAVYDNLALQILRSAARFAELGVEPRHLRMYKVSAEREAGFIEQLVMPLLKQRNPEARARARESARELLELGALMHAAVLARELGPDVAP